MVPVYSPKRKEDGTPGALGAGGSALGAIIGSVIPGIGTLAGAAAGSAIGGAAGKTMGAIMRRGGPDMKGAISNGLSAAQGVAGAPPVPDMGAMSPIQRRLSLMNDEDQNFVSGLGRRYF